MATSSLLLLHAIILFLLTLPLPSSTLSHNSSALSLSLHSRSSLSNDSNDDYNSLILARLARDSARVHSISLSLSRLLNSPSSSKITDSPPAPVISAPVTSGLAQGTGEYFALLGIGNPVKTYYWVIDTGSDITWLQCKPCSRCYSQSDPVYDPLGSNSYHTLFCFSPDCPAFDGTSCDYDTCTYMVKYGDRSSTIGDAATETLFFGSSGTVDNFKIGCGHDNQGLFIAAAGLIGLGGGSLSLPSQIQATSFSYCLVDRKSTSSSTLDFNTGELEGSITTTLVRNKYVDTYRYINLVGISVGGRSLPIPSLVFAVDPATGMGGTIVDSGTTVTRLPAQAYNALRDEFLRQAPSLERTGRYELLDTCFNLANKRQEEVIPTVSFNFPGNQTLPIPPEGVLVAVDNSGKFCLAFSTSDAVSIIGNLQQQNTRVNFDLINSIVQFKPHSC